MTEHEIPEDLMDRYDECCNPDSNVYSAWECTLIERIAKAKQRCRELEEFRLAREQQFDTQEHEFNEKLAASEQAREQLQAEIEQLREQLQDEELAFTHANDLVGKYETDARNAQAKVAGLEQCITRAEQRLETYEDCFQQLGVTSLAQLVERYDAKLTSAEQHCRELEGKLERIKYPTVYTGEYYASVKTTEVCPECDSREFVSYGAKGMICFRCSLLQANDELLQARERAERAMGQMRNIIEDYRGCCERTDDCVSDPPKCCCGICQRADIALAEAAQAQQESGEGKCQS